MTKKAPAPTLTPDDEQAAMILQMLVDNAKQEKRLKQKDIAKLTGLSQAAVSHHINAIAPMSADVVLKYAKVLGVTPGTIDHRLAYLNANDSTILLEPAAQTPKKPSGVLAPFFASADSVTEWLAADSEAADRITELADTVLLEESYYRHKAFAIRAGITGSRPRNIDPSDTLIVDPLQRPKGGELGLWLLDDKLEIGTYAISEGALYFISPIGVPPIRLGNWDKRFLGRISLRITSTPLFLPA